jgi:hypothetical protein
MSDEDKAKYARLINNLQSIAYGMENTKTTVNNITPSLANGLVKNDEIVEEDTIDDITSNISNQKNRLYNIIRNMTYNMYR